MEKKVQGTIYYVDSHKGSDNNQGTSVDRPWQTLERINAQSFKPGDKILFEAHGTWCGGLKVRGSGQVKAPIVIDNYIYEEGKLQIGVPQIRPLIEGEGKVLYTLWLHNVSFWEVNHLEITNKGEEPLAGRTGVMVSGDDDFDQVDGNALEHLYLNHLYVHDVNGDATTKDGHNGGIYYNIFATDQDRPIKFKDVRVQNCYVKDVARTGISVGSTRCLGLSSNLSHHTPEELKQYMHEEVLIRNNYVERSGGDAIVPQYCYEPLIEHNVSQEASIGTQSDPNLMYNAAIWPWQCYRALFQYNEAFGTYLNGDGQAYDCDFSWGTTYQYNYSHDNEGGFMLVCQDNTIDSVVRYNISQNDRRCLFMTSNKEPAYIYNNTFYIGEHLDTKIFSNDHGPMVCWNNIFYKEGKAQLLDWHEEDVTYDTNLYYGFSNIPEDAHSIVEDPLFISAGVGQTGNLAEGPTLDTLQGYCLQAHSPALYKGKVIKQHMLPATSGFIEEDFYDQPIKDRPTLGAIEYGLSTYTPETAKAYTDYQKQLKHYKTIIRSGVLSEDVTGQYYEAHKDQFYKQVPIYRVECIEEGVIIEINEENRRRYMKDYPKLMEELAQRSEGEVFSLTHLDQSVCQMKCIKKVERGYKKLREVKSHIELQLAKEYDKCRK